MNILVLGSEGLIGKALCSKLETNHVVMRFDKKTGNDINDEHGTDYLESVVRNTDFVYFLAFDVGGAEYLYKHEHTFDFISNNVKMMERVFDLLGKHKKPFVFISSMMTKMPQSTYGILKSIGERYSKSLNGVSVRFWNVYGPEEIEKGKNHVITDFIVSALAEQQITCKTDGSEVRQFIHTKSAANALELVMNNYQEVVEASKDDLNCVDITNEKWISIGSIARYLERKLDCELTFSATKDKVQKELQIYPNLAIIQKLGWKEEIGFYHGVDELISIYKKKLGV